MGEEEKSKEGYLVPKKSLLELLHMTQMIGSDYKCSILPALTSLALVMNTTT